MDSVRFGRALGTGARLAAQTAAKTLVTAVDAATAPNPSAPQPSASAPPSQSGSSPRPEPPNAFRPSPAIVTNLRETTQGIARGSRRFGETVWGPVVKLSGVLWLEVTGVFFALFAVFAAVGVWKLRGSLHPSAADIDTHRHLELALVMTVVFGYFSISSFLRASRRGRRR